MKKNDFRINVDAARALIDWRSRLADEIVARARLLAADSDQPNIVTLSHYRKAARIAAQSLLDAILDEETSNGDQEAA